MVNNPIVTGHSVLKTMMQIFVAKIIVIKIMFITVRRSRNEEEKPTV